MRLGGRVRALSTARMAIVAPDPSRYAAPKADLLQKVLIMRHGDRGPISESAGSIVLDPAVWSKRMPSAEKICAWDHAFPVDGPTLAIDAGHEPFGSLTTVGAQQCHALGTALRRQLEEHAPHLIPSAPEHIAVRATNIRRTQHSVQNLLFGLLAGEPFTVPITVNPFERETLLPNPRVCPTLQRRLEEIKGTETVAPADAAVLDAAAAAMGYGDAGQLRLDQAREVLCCKLAHGDPLPAGISEEMLVRLMRINARRWGHRFADDVVKRLGMGQLLHEIASSLSAAAQPVGSDAPPGLVILSGHDSSIVPLLVALGPGLFDDEWPFYAASVAIELGRIHGSPDGSDPALGVRLLYNGAVLPLQGAMRAVGSTEGGSVVGMAELPHAAQLDGWVPWHAFRHHLHQLSATESEHLAACYGGADGGDGSGGSRDLNDGLVAARNLGPPQP